MLVNGRPRHPQSQGSVEKSNSSLKNTLVAWMRDDKSKKWTYGLLFSQWALNTLYHEATKNIPYKILFGVKPRIGLKTHLPAELLQNIKTGIEKEVFIGLWESAESNQVQKNIQKELQNELQNDIQMEKLSPEEVESLETIDINE